MPVFQFQKAFAQLLTDADMRRSVFAGEPGALAGLGLSQEQQEHLRGMETERVEIYSELLVVNRLTKAMEGLPWTTHLLGTELWPIANDFNQARPPEHAKKYDEAMVFGHYLLERFESRPSALPFVEDVLLYEMTSLDLRCSFDGLYDADFTDRTTELFPMLHDDHAWPSVVPKRLLHNRIVSLNHDVERLGEEIDAGQTPTDAERRVNYILFRVDPSGALAQDEVNLPTVLFVEACDGRTPLDAVIEGLARDFGQDTPSQLPNFKQRCLELCESLIERHVIGLRPAHAS
jgi:hypothetical protein